MGQSENEEHAHREAPAANRPGSTRYPVNIGFVFACLILMSIGWVAYNHIQNLVATGGWVTHTHLVIEKITLVLSRTKDIETGGRGFVITGDERYLEPYTAAVAVVSDELKQLHELTLDNPRQQQRVDRLEPLVSSKIEIVAEMISTRRTSGFVEASQSALIGRSKAAMDSIRVLADEMIQEEHSLLEKRSAEAQAATSRALAILAGGTIASIVLLAAVFFALRREILQRRRIQDGLIQSEERLRLFTSGVKEYAIFMLDPAGRVTNWNDGAERIKGYTAAEIIGRHFSCFYSQEDIKQGKPGLEIKKVMEVGRMEDEGWRVRKDGSRFWANVVITAIRNPSGVLLGFSKITRDMNERKQTEEAIQKLNEDLKRRAEELTAANKELEAFSYSVSHDLRAPLRHINGYVELLNKYSASALDAKSVHYLKTIADSANQMGTLIDDLLVFSRMGRSEMRWTQVDLAVQVRNTIDSMSPDTKERKVEWKVGAMPSVRGDAAMLRQVIYNLIGNAVKYTRTRETAEIEIGSSNGAGENIVFVKDNGVGFDMQYADKLFGVFQRLHSSDEFEGTGIGLANVRRIVQRHGGRTWAEGKVDVGASVYFSLPIKEEVADERH